MLHKFLRIVLVIYLFVLNSYSFSMKWNSRKFGHFPVTSHTQIFIRFDTFVYSFIYLYIRTYAQLSTASILYRIIRIIGIFDDTRQQVRWSPVSPVYFFYSTKLWYWFSLIHDANIFFFTLFALCEMYVWQIRHRCRLASVIGTNFDTDFQ